MHFRGKLMHGGQVVQKPVEGDLDFQTLGGIRDWFGHLNVPADKTISDGVYRLVLEDNRAIEILVTGGSYASNRVGVVNFKGRGSLQ